MSLDGLTSENCLFLICPTDGMEPILANRFNGQAFFYAALGACFEWDIATQQSLAKLIKKRNIKHITLLMKVTNTFFIDKVKVKYNLANYAVEKTLQFIEDKIPEHLKHWDKSIPKQEILATAYLEHQKHRLQKTMQLGKLIDSKKIKVTSLLYSEIGLKFIKTNILKQKIELCEAISIN